MIDGFAILCKIFQKWKFYWVFSYICEYSLGSDTKPNFNIRPQTYSAKAHYMFSDSLDCVIVVEYAVP